MLRRERLPELGRSADGHSRCSEMTVCLRSGVVLDIRVGELVVRHRRTTKDGLVRFVSLVWGLSWSRWSMIHGMRSTSTWSLEEFLLLLARQTLDWMSTKPKPPVVQPGAGNNIIINPNQVGAVLILSTVVDPCKASEPTPQLHSQRRERVWRHRARLSSRSNDMYPIP